MTNAKGSLEAVLAILPQHDPRKMHIYRYEGIKTERLITSDYRQKVDELDVCVSCVALRVASLLLWAEVDRLRDVYDESHACHYLWQAASDLEALLRAHGMERTT